MYLSIDPGQKGGAVLVDVNGIVIDKCIFDSSYKDFIRIVKNNKQQIKKVIIENVRGYAGENVKSVFTFGKSLGHAEGILICFGFKVDQIARVEPRSWVSFFKDCFKIKGKRKSCDLVKRTFLEKTGTIYRYDSLSDAYLIWFYWFKLNKSDQ